LVSQDFSDLAQRSPSLEHFCSQAVTKLMRTFTRRINSGPRQSVSYDIAHCLLALEADGGCSGPEKHTPAAGYSGSPVFQVGSDRLAYLCGQG